MRNDKELDYDLARAIQLSFELESVFGVDHLPKGERLPESAELSSEVVPVTTAVDSPRLPQPSAHPSAPGSSTKASPKPRSLISMAEELASCQACALCHTRNQVVFGQGNARARLMFITDGPNAEEDASGAPYGGAEGQLLAKMIAAMKLDPADVYLTNVLKCRPHGSEPTLAPFVEVCSSFLREQIAFVAPEIICTMGPLAFSVLRDQDGALDDLRGQEFRFGNLPVIPTFDPKFLLANPQAKKPVWQDLQKVMAFLGL